MPEGIPEPQPVTDASDVSADAHQQLLEVPDPSSRSLINELLPRATELTPRQGGEATGRFGSLRTVIDSIRHYRQIRRLTTSVADTKAALVDNPRAIDLRGAAETRLYSKQPEVDAVALRAAMSKLHSGDSPEK